MVSSKFSFLPIISRPSKLKRDIIFKEISDLLLSGAISIIPPNPHQVVSRIFCVPKQNGKNRLIIDLSLLNNYVNKCSFRLEDKETIKCLIEPNDYMVSIDLCNAFHSIRLHNSSKHLVTFEFENIRYNFNVIPFGLSSAPRIFTKILRPVIAHLRNRGLKISSYLDDIFICNSSYEKVSQDLLLTLDILKNLGFSINEEKSVFIPTQKLLHLGYIWDSINCSLFLPENKLLKIKSLVSKCLSYPQTIRTYSNLLGNLVSSANAFNFAPLYYRKFQLCFIKGLKSSFSWDALWELDSGSISDLSWWHSCTLSMVSPVYFRSNNFDFILYTDSSLSGWGAYLSSGDFTSGNWSGSERKSHINVLELRAIYLAIIYFLPKLKFKNISIKCDNSTAIAYFNKMGGTHSKSLCLLALDTWSILKENSIRCCASHISGIKNNVADFLSRHSHFHEFALSPPAFSYIQSCINFPLHLDLFASKDNNKLPSYCSLFIDKNCVQTDAFSFVWPSYIYVFPPLPLISRALMKIFRDKVEFCLFLTPAWHTLSVIPILTKSLIDNPIFIPSNHLLGCLPMRHPFNLMAWPISASSVKTREFQKLSQKLSSRASEKALSNHILDIGNHLLIGLIQKKILPKLLQS